LAAAAIVLCAGTAWADPPTFTGMVSTDFRAAVEEERQGELIWNLNIAELALKQRINPHIRYELDLRVNFDGLSLAGEGHPLMDLTNAAAIDPFWLESDAANVTFRNVFDGFDVVVGRQIVTWGASDRFRPTNNLNPDDVWDPLRFGITQANEMVRLLYNPVGDLILEAVLVPVFRPARLPATATAALMDPDSEIPVIEPEVAARIAALHDMMTGFEFRTAADTMPPSLSLENMQVGARISWRTEESDWSLSYYRGFDDFPHPVTSAATAHLRDACEGELSDPEAIGCVDTQVGLAYPEIQVVGFDIAGQIPALDDAGFRIEGAFVYPEETHFAVDIPEMYGQDVVGHVLDGRGFLKATFGIDYTFSREIFALAMIVHGMVNELGAQAIGDYAVVGADFKLFGEKLLIRLFGIAALETEHPSGAIMPLVQWNPWSAMELETGGLVLLGDDKSKLGQPAAGESLVFLRSRVRF
jgi:hypothetical protein